MDFSFDGLSFELSWRDTLEKFEQVHKSRALNQIRGKYELFGQHLRNIITKVASDWLLPAKIPSEKLEQNVLESTVFSSAMDPNPSSVGNLSSENEISGDSVTKLSMNIPSCTTQDLSSESGDEMDGDSVAKLSESGDEVLKKNSSENAVSARHDMEDPNPSTEENSSLTTDRIDLATNSDNSSSAVASLALDGATSRSALDVQNLTACGNAEGVNERELPMEQGGMQLVETCECLDEGVNSKNLPEVFEDVDLSDCRKDDEDFQYAFVSVQESRPSSSIKKKIDSSIITILRKMRGRKQTSYYRNAIIREEEGRQGNDLPAADSKNCCAEQHLEFEWEML